MDPIDENFDIGLIEGQKIFYKQARTVLKERTPGVQGLSFHSVRKFCRKRSMCSRISTEKVTEIV